MSLLSAIREFRERRRDRSEFQRSVYVGNLDRIRQMVDGGFDCRRAGFRSSVLEMAIVSDASFTGIAERTASKQEVFDYLRKFFEPLHVRDHPNLLVAACIAQHNDLAKELLEFGWDVHSRGTWESPPLAYSVRSKNTELFDLLVAHGANKKDYRDKTWYQVNAEMIERLAGIGVDVPDHVLDAVREGKW